MHEGGNYQDFLKWGRGVFLGRSLIMIKWTWGFFSQNLQFDPSPLQLDTRENKRNTWILQNYIKLIINHYANQPLPNIALIHCNPIMFNNADYNTLRPKFPVHILCKFYFILVERRCKKATFQIWQKNHKYLSRQVMGN